MFRLWLCCGRYRSSGGLLCGARDSETHQEEAEAFAEGIEERHVDYQGYRSGTERAPEKLGFAEL